ncbi:DNA alkylation repair protein [Candidatus Woesearchaeota archaeon]|nr:DNA alkylation repair protein [Candidatus Woesearchaeota archaeon]
MISEIKEELKKNIDRKYKEGAEKYFKEPVKFYGVRTPDVRKTASVFYKQIKNKQLRDIFKISEDLMKTGIFELVTIGIAFLEKSKNQFSEKDFKTIESLLKRYINNWGHCDDLCNHTIGFFIEKYPEVIPKIKAWSKSSNRWLRRASAVSFILPARKGNNLNDVFEIADVLLCDKDDLVQKGYGWMLKEASRKHQKEVFNYIQKNKAKMPRTALRYAIELMPPSLRKKALQK